MIASDGILPCVIRALSAVELKLLPERLRIYTLLGELREDGHFYEGSYSG